MARAVTFLMFLLLAVCPRAQSGSVPISGEMVDKLLRGLEQRYEQGYELGRHGGLHVALMRDGHSAKETFGVTQGRTYRFIAVGASGVQDVGLELDLVTETGRLREYRTGPIGELEFTAKKTGSLTAIVTLASSESKTTSYEVSLLAVEKTSQARTPAQSAKWINQESPKIKGAFSRTGAASVARKLAAMNAATQHNPWYCILVHPEAGAEGLSFHPQYFKSGNRAFFGGEPGAQIMLSITKNDEKSAYRQSSTGSSGILLIPGSSTDSTTLVLANKSQRTYVAIYILEDPRDTPTTPEATSTSSSPTPFTSSLRWGRSTALKLVSQMQRHYRDGYEMGTWGALQLAYLAPARSATEVFSFEAGRKYRLVAVGGDAVEDVDLFIETANGHVLASDSKSNRDAEVTFTAPSSDLYNVRVKLHKLSPGITTEDVGLLAMAQSSTVPRSDAIAQSWYKSEVRRMESAFEGVDMSDIGTLSTPPTSWYTVLAQYPATTQTTLAPQALSGSVRVRVGAELGGLAGVALLRKVGSTPFAQSGSGRAAEVISNGSTSDINVRISNNTTRAAYIVAYIFWKK